jgi:Tol biopolymer transport system component
MPLSVGDQLGPYVVTAPIGAGGMGEVYKAKDTRLDRSVALKVLPEHIAKREDLRARFEREARAVASLNHPNICTLYDIGSQDGVGGYMVMELIEGESLAARIEKGPVPLDQALAFATQIADALDRAHRAGVTHRDVKPQNIMLTRDGVKVLDFGLAKSQAKPGPTEETLTNVLTTEGTIMGTPQYMAPEQFAGKEADARSDIWAFGAVLYEMVTGRKAFQGSNYQSLVGAILAMDPAPMAVKPFPPAWLERLVRRCLAKDPENRYHCMRDIVLDLRTPPVEAAIAKPANRWPWIAAAGVCLVLGVAAGALWLGGRTRTAPAPVMLEVAPPPGSQFAGIVDGGGSAISPDGRTLAFIARDGNGQGRLYVRPLNSREARALPGTEDAARPFWSPDSRSLAFVAAAGGARGTLKTIEVAGGTPVNLHEVRFARGGTWNRDGVILFADTQTPLRRIPATGGKAVPVTQPGPGDLHYFPQFLPDGKRFLYLGTGVELRMTGEVRTSALYLASLDGKGATRIVDTNFKSVYDSASGKLLYMREPGKLLAQTFELDPPRLTGEPAVVAEGIGVTTSNRLADFSVSSDGTLFFGQRNGAGRLLQFGWRDRVGRLVEAIGSPVPARLWFSVSPDERRFASYADVGSGGSSDLWVMEMATGLRTRLAFENPRGPVWSPDGQSIYYLNPRSGIIKRKSTDGSGEAEPLVTGVNTGGIVHDVSPDGKYLLYQDEEMMVLPLTGERKPRRYLESSASSGHAVFSPDGHWVAYSSSESGRSEIYVQGFPNPGGKWAVSAEGGSVPRWRRDGREIYWAGPDNTLMAARIALGPGGPKVERAEALFPLSAAGGFPNFRPSRDGQRFLVLDLPKDADPNPPMVVLLHWAAGLGK